MDTILGGDGDDTLVLHRYTGADVVEVIDLGAGVNRISGTAGDDVISFLETEVLGVSSMDAGAGNDILYGTLEADVLIGGLGQDDLRGSGGDDLFLIEGDRKSVV